MFNYFSKFTDRTGNLKADVKRLHAQGFSLSECWANLPDASQDAITDIFVELTTPDIQLPVY